MAEPSPSHPASDSSSERGFRNRGSITVGIVIVVGIAAAATAYIYWTNFVQQDDPGPKINAKQAFDKEAATEELVKLDTEFAQSKHEKRFNTILQKTRAFVSRYPNFPDGHTLLGKIYIEMYQWENAYECFTTSLNLDERQPIVHHLAGTMCYEMKQYDICEEHYMQAKFLNPENPLHHVYLAQVHIRTNRPKSALTLCLNALTLEPNYHEAYATMSDLFLTENDLPRALQKIDQALKFVQQELDDRKMVIEYVVRRARVLRRMNEPDDAMQELENNLHDMEHTLPRVAKEIAITWGHLGKPEKAAEFLDNAVIKTERMDMQILALAAEWQIRIGQLPVAEQYIQRIIDIDPTKPAIKQLQSQIESVRKKKEADAKAAS